MHPSHGSRIVIVGAGPTGLSAAVLLRQRGHHPIVIDRRAGLAGLPAAHVANTRTMEVFGEMGIAEAVRRRADPEAMGSLVAWVESMAGRQYGLLPILGAARDERGPLSPYKSMNIPQTELEPILFDRLTGLGGAVRFGEEVAGVEVAGSIARVWVRPVSGDDDARRIECDWLLGCDGAGSVVRRSVGIEMVGPRTLARFMTIYFTTDLDRYREGRRGLLYWIGGKEARGVFISFDAPGRTWAMLVPIGDLPLEAFDEEAARGIVHKAIGSREVEVSLLGLSTWNMSAQVANTFRNGPVLLAGDACHRFPPTGGLGMNTGIQDAHNLVWKLAAVIEGRAPDGLLDTYEQERRPIAQRNTDQSVSNLMRMGLIDEALGISTLAPIAADAGAGPIATYGADALGIDGDSPGAVARRAKVQSAIDEQTEHFAQGAGIDLGWAYEAGAFVPDGSAPPSAGICHYRPDAHPGSRLPHAAVAGDGFAGSTLGLVARAGVTLFATDPRWSAVAARAAADTGVATRTYVVVEEFAGEAARVTALLGTKEGGAVAVRPDGCVLWRAPAWSDEALEQLSHALRVSHGLDAAGMTIDPRPHLTQKGRNAMATIRPALHHVTFKTTRLQEMVDWYRALIGVEVTFQDANNAWTTNDAANHRIAFLSVPGLGDDPDKLKHNGIHHSAFEYGSFDDLMSSYERLRDEGILPAFSLDHGLTMSLYYKDPEGNYVELQSDNFGDWEQSTEWMRTSPDFKANPIGTFFDPEKVLRAHKDGRAFSGLQSAIRAGEFLPDSTPSIGLPIPVNTGPSKPAL